MLYTWTIMYMISRIHYILNIIKLHICADIFKFRNYRSPAYTRLGWSRLQRPQETAKQKLLSWAALFDFQQPPAWYCFGLLFTQKFRIDCLRGCKDRASIKQTVHWISTNLFLIVNEKWVSHCIIVLFHTKSW
jgi:hypothetical protein